MTYTAVPGNGMHVNTMRGLIAQNKAELRAIEKGYMVSRPITECTRYDLIIDDGNHCERIQVKYAGGKHRGIAGSCLVDFRSNTSSGRRIDSYNRDEVDAVLVYIPPLDRLCYFPIELVENRTTMTIRYEPSKNGQSKGVILAEDYLW